MSKTVFIKTYGCQMNVYDSERIGDVLAAQGYGPAAAPEGADLVVLNTCHIREKAVDKVYSEIGKLRELKEAGGGAMKIVVAGCVAQAEGGEIMRRVPAVDAVVGPQSYHRLGQLLEQPGQSRAIDFRAEEKFETLKPSPIQRGVSAYITVQEGCDKFCSFCVVPYTRGVEFSRPVAQIEHEARALAETGVREITLLGQNVNAYRGAGPDGAPWSLGLLITQLSRIDGIARIRFTTSHPRDMDDTLIETLAVNPKAMPYLHLPVQAGSDRILKAMNRGHTAETYLKLIAKVRQACPDIAISGDFIAGFPGETDADFGETLALVRAVGYASAYSFKYSPRPGTPAAERGEQVPEAVKSQRLQQLQSLLEQQSAAFNARCLGRTLPVLLDRQGREPGQMGGRSPYLQAVHVSANGQRIGEICHVAIDTVGARSLSGHIAAAA